MTDTLLYFLKFFFLHFHSQSRVITPKIHHWLSGTWNFWTVRLTTLIWTIQIRKPTILIEENINERKKCDAKIILFFFFQAIYEMLGPEVTKSADDSPRKRAKMIFEKMDVNNDRELTLKEFVDGCLADRELFSILTNEVKK